MLRPRIIPCLLVRDKGLVKTVGFTDPKYVGDPINAVKIFNEKGVDELMVLDIDATRQGREPDYRMIENLATESRMPLSYGGGIKTAEQAKTVIALGVEKVSISSGAIEHDRLVSAVAEAVGSQSVVVVLDVKTGRAGQPSVWIRNGTIDTGKTPRELAVEMERRGAGEIVLNSIDRDGRMRGYDVEMAAGVRDATNVPLTILGGAGTLKDVEALIRRFGVVGAAAGSIFVFKGVYRAVLINYPSSDERAQLVRECLEQP